MADFNIVQKLIAHLSLHQIRANHIGNNRIRFVVHLNHSNEDIARVCEVLSKFSI